MEVELREQYKESNNSSSIHGIYFKFRGAAEFESSGGNVLTVQSFVEYVKNLNCLEEEQEECCCWGKKKAKRRPFLQI